MPLSTIGMVVFAIIIVIVYVVYSRKKMGQIAAVNTGLGGQQAKDVTADLARGDLTSLISLLESCQEGAWDDRDFFAEILCDKVPWEGIERLVEEYPEDPLVYLVRGFAGVEQAWIARGRGTSDTVSDEDQETFEAFLSGAQDDLMKAAALDPDDPTPWAKLIHVANGLGLNRKVAERFFEEATTREPTHHSAHRAMLNYLTEKWNGSHEEMFAFARQAGVKAPVGSDLKALIIMAHIERWLYFTFDNDKKGVNRYLKNKETLNECRQAHAQSLGSPNLRNRWSTIFARNVAAFWFYLVDDKKRTRTEIGLIQHGWTQTPWRYWNDPEKAYAEAAEWAFGVNSALNLFPQS